MKSIIALGILTLSLNAVAMPFELENLNFLNSDGASNTTQISNYDTSQPYNINNIRLFEPSVNYGVMNSSASYNENLLGYDINNVGMMWMDSVKNVWALDFSTGGPVKLLDGSVITSLENEVLKNEIQGLYSYYGFTGLEVPGQGYNDIGSAYRRENSTISAYGFEDLELGAEIDCGTFGSCNNGDIVGMQYFDSRDDGLFNGDLLYLVQNEDGSILNNSIYAYNLGTNDTNLWSSLTDLGITDDIAPTKGMTFFSKDDLTINAPVEVTEPGTISLLTIGAVAIVASRTGLKAICKKSGVCLIYDVAKKAIVGTAKVAK